MPDFFLNLFRHFFHFFMTFYFLSNVAGKLRDRSIIHIQQISNTASITPIDLWYPTGPYLDPQRCDQVSAGFFRNFNLDKYELDPN